MKVAPKSIHLDLLFLSFRHTFLPFWYTPASTPNIPIAIEVPTITFNQKTLVFVLPFSIDSTCNRSPSPFAYYIITPLFRS